ncbi:sensor histidine kinase [Nocardia albiluteola]|nr:nitrate- and nitrite sensing domain-containing protein [Nocardia albiluteola]
MQFRRAPLLPNGSKQRATTIGLLRPRTIRGQLIRVLAVSVVLVLVLLGLLMAGQVRAYRATDKTVRAVSLTLSVQDLVQEVQRERGLSNGMLAGDAAMRQALDAQRPATDRALQALSAALDDRAPGVGDVRAALRDLAALSDERAGIDAHRTDRTTAFAFYTDAITALTRTRLGLDHAQDDQVWRGLSALYSLGDAKEFTAQERGFLSGVFAAGGFGPGEYVQFLDIRAAKQAALETYPRDATPSERVAVTSLMHSADALRSAESEGVAIAAQHGPLLTPVSATDWWAQTSSVIDAERGVQQSIGADINQRAQHLRQIAERTLVGYGVGTLLALLVLARLVFSGVRAIVRPLAALAATADEVATQRLPALIRAWQDPDADDPGPPEPVPAPERASVEIAQVAVAFDRVQTTAYELGAAQATVRRNTTESLANLGRRNQNLLRRQLALISEFEREELDPRALSNMFELDHLATRMRRNAESLLVMVGQASPRRWSEPIPLTDVIRAALSEVENYRRVVVRRVDDVPVTGGVVSELAHMLAELIENGLSFSPPEVEVEIYGRLVGQRYLLAVVDHGIGMSPEQLAAANARLRGEADFMVAPTRFLGHHVVGRLSRRLGIEVELTVSPISGVAARMLLPLTLLAGPVAPRTSLALQSAQAALPAGGSPTTLSASEDRSALEAAAHDRPAIAADHNARAPFDPAPANGSNWAFSENPVTATDSAPYDASTNGAAARPDPFPTLPPGRIKDSLNALSTQRNRHSVQSAWTNGQAPGTAPATPTPRSSPPVTDPNPAEPQSNAPGHSERAATAAPEVERTRNGLVKRAKRIPSPTAPDPVAATPASPAPPRHRTSPAVDHSAEQTRGMLSSFRAGHRRGEMHEPAPIPASTAQEDPR